MIHNGSESVQGGTGWFFVAQVHCGAVLLCAWRYWVSIDRYWLICDDTESVEGGICWYLVVLVQYGAVLLGTWWYSVRIGRYCLVLSNTGGSGSPEGCAVWYFVVLYQYGQSQKRRKLSGQQDFCRKNFLDKARKSRQFSNLRQMRIKGGFDHPNSFQIIWTHYMDTFRIIQKLSRLSRHTFRSSRLSRYIF